jgi:hypothetical protein
MQKKRLTFGVPVLVKERFKPADLVERIRQLAHTKVPRGTEMEAAS